MGTYGEECGAVFSSKEKTKRGKPRNEFLRKTQESGYIQNQMAKWRTWNAKLKRFFKLFTICVRLISFRLFSEVSLLGAHVLALSFIGIVFYSWSLTHEL
jgi:hypothetical protein